MKAVAFRSPGPPEVMQVMECKDPIPGAEEVRVRVKAVGVQPVDCAVRSGKFGPLKQSPQLLGNEFAGVIDRVGEKVTSFAVGDEVIGWCLLASFRRICSCTSNANRKKAEKYAMA